MRRCCAVFLLCLTINIRFTLSHEVNAASCDRYRSRLARNVIKKYIAPKVQQLQFNYPPHCPLALSKDIYYEQERVKIRGRGGSAWRCGACGKLFRAEDYLDLHLEQQHPHLTSQESDVCLAEMCDALHCMHFAQLDVGHHGHEHGTLDPSDPYSPHTACRESTAATRRHMCQEVGRLCFPEAGGHASRLLHEMFVDNLCAAHTCDRGLREDILHHINKSQEAMVWPLRILFGCLLLVLGFFYFGVISFHSQQGGYRTAGDVRRVRQKHQRGWRLFAKKSKAY